MCLHCFIRQLSPLCVHVSTVFSSSHFFNILDLEVFFHVDVTYFLCHIQDFVIIVIHMICYHAT